MKVLPSNPRFFKPINPGFKNSLKIPKSVSKFFLGTAKNLSDEAFLNRKGKEWRVTVRNGCFVGRRWARLAEKNRLKTGDFVVFKYYGNMVFSVTVLDGMSQCKRKYDANRDSSPEPKKRSKLEEIPAEQVPETIVFRSHFIAKISKTHTEEWSCLFLPRDFSESSELKGRNGEIAVKDEQERSWSFDLTTSSTDGRVRIRRASQLADFFTANGFKIGDSFKFEISGAKNPGEMPVARIRHSNSCSYSSRIKPYSLAKNQCLCIPRRFAVSNRLCRNSLMILENREQRTWQVTLSYADSRLNICGGWKKFAEENGIKVGDSFTFEIVENGEVPVARFILN